MNESSLVLERPPGWQPSDRAVSSLVRLLLPWGREQRESLDRALAVIGDDPEWQAFLLAGMAMLQVYPDADLTDPATLDRVCDAAGRVRLTQAGRDQIGNLLKMAAGYGPEAMKKDFARGPLLTVRKN
jgi:hypothetical protein